jgi:delta-aminolevulinic acid dehydratase/porphobilinogen synthase
MDDTQRLAGSKKIAPAGKADGRVAMQVRALNSHHETQQVHVLCQTAEMPFEYTFYSVFNAFS